MSKKTKIIIASVSAAVVVAIIIVAVTLSLVFMSKGPFSGTVVEEGTNAPLAGVMVSDGRNVVKTDENGAFYLEGYHKSRFVTVTTPSGYNTDDFYIPVDKQRESYDFTLKKLDKTYENGHSFLQISDSEISAPIGEWKEHVKGLINELDPAFLIHTGDIHGKKGLSQHIKDMNSQNMGIPVRYVIGNHDYVDWGGYGEAFYESLYGPVWYSFDVANVHYVVTPFQNGGDYASGYNQNDRWKWLKNDLDNVDPNMKVVMFNHTTPPSDDYVISYGSNKIDLKQHNLIAWIFGHYHYNFVEENNGVVNISTARPDAGGIDSSVSGTRHIKISTEGELSTQMHYYDYEKPVATPEGAIWSNEDLKGNVLFCDTLLVDGIVLVATAHDDYPATQKCGVYAIDAQTGKTKWYYYTDNSVKNNLVYADSKVIAQDVGGKVYCMNIQDGTKVWERTVSLGKSLGTSSGIVTDGSKVYVGCASEITALNVSDGGVAWNVKRNSGENSPSEFILVGDKLIVGSHWDALVALDKNTKKQLWQKKDEHLRFRSSTPAVIDENTLLVADSDAIMKVNLANGNIISKFISPKDEKGNAIYNFNSSSKPYIKNGIAYIATSNKGVIAFNIAEEKIVWNFVTDPSLAFTAPYTGKGTSCVESSFVEINGALVFGANDGKLYKLSMTDGMLLNKINIGSPIFGKVAIDTDGKVIVCDFEGRVFKLAI